MSGADPQTQVTMLLGAIGRGDPRAAEDLLPLVYGELRRLAESRLARLAPGQTLQATALVHEAYLDLVGSGDPGWNGRGHFFGAAAQAMREIVVDHARAKSRLKRGGDRKRVAFSEAAAAVGFESDIDVLALDEALDRLEAERPAIAQMVKLRFFAGLTMNQVAEIADTPLRTLERDWRFARAWLHRELEG